MKKKGFTLIELIVVIAIIGVLAGILVPAMMGYIRKSKLQSANSALMELNEAEADLSGLEGTHKHEWLATEVSAIASDNKATEANLWAFMESYIDDVKRLEFQLGIKNSVVVACSAASNAYYGTSPIAFTNKTYSSSVTLDSAFDAAVDKYNASHHDDEY